MDNKMMVLIKKYLIVIIGQVIIGIGCAFMVTSGQGNDPMGVMVSGFSQIQHSFWLYDKHYQFYYFCNNAGSLPQKTDTDNTDYSFCNRLDY